MHLYKLLYFDCKHPCTLSMIYSIWHAFTCMSCQISEEPVSHCFLMSHLALDQVIIKWFNTVCIQYLEGIRDKLLVGIKRNASPAVLMSLGSSSCMENNHRYWSVWKTLIHRSFNLIISQSAAAHSLVIFWSWACIYLSEVFITFSVTQFISTCMCTLCLYWTVLCSITYPTCITLVPSNDVCSTI